MSEMASQITSLTNVYPTVYSGADQRKYQSSASLAFVGGGGGGGIHRWPAQRASNAEKFPFDDVIMIDLKLDMFTHRGLNRSDHLLSYSADSTPCLSIWLVNLFQIFLKFSRKLRIGLTSDLTGAIIIGLTRTDWLKIKLCWIQHRAHALL